MHRFQISILAHMRLRKDGVFLPVLMVAIKLIFRHYVSFRRDRK